MQPSGPGARAELTALQLGPRSMEKRGKWSLLPPVSCPVAGLQGSAVCTPEAVRVPWKTVSSALSGASPHGTGARIWVTALVEAPARPANHPAGSSGTPTASAHTGLWLPAIGEHVTSTHHLVFLPCACCNTLPPTVRPKITLTSPLTGPEARSPKLRCLQSWLRGLQGRALVPASSEDVPGDCWLPVACGHIPSASASTVSSPSASLLCCLPPIRVPVITSDPPE